MRLFFLMWEEPLGGDRYIHYADLHSHNDFMDAVFLTVDDRDERANRIYGRPATHRTISPI